MLKPIPNLRVAMVLLVLILVGHRGAAAPSTDGQGLAWQAGLPGTVEEVDRLRSQGSRTMERVLARLDESPGGVGSLTADEVDRLDRLCGVRDCASLRLFWFTDLEAAKAEARASGKPILSLRLLGRLDEDFSCANSRFFRTVLYANQEIGEMLRQRFVLHWRSVRPVPRVTIDFGDGRVLEQTLTGNSIHYVLDRQGRLIDALPGLYGPSVFRRELRDIERIAERAELLLGASFHDYMQRYHGSQVIVTNNALVIDLEELDRRQVAAQPRPTQIQPAVSAEKSDSDAQIPGLLVGRVNVKDVRTSSKSSFEGNVSLAVGRRPASWAVDGLVVQEPLGPADIGSTLEDERWEALGRLHPEAGRLDAASRAFLLRKQGVQDPDLAKRLIASFEHTVAIDTLFNEYQLHRVLHGWLEKAAAAGGVKDLEEFNDRVYRDLFGTPPEDPWLGLAPNDVYSALPGGATRTQLPEAP